MSDPYRTPADVWRLATLAGHETANQDLAAATFAANTFEALWNRDRRTLARVLGVEPEEDDEEDTGELGDPGALAAPIPYTLAAGPAEVGG